MQESPRSEVSPRADLWFDRPASRMGIHELKLDRWPIGPDGRSVDHGWVHEFRSDVADSAGGLVHANETEAETKAEVAGDLPADLRETILIQRL